METDATSYYGDLEGLKRVVEGQDVVIPNNLLFLSDLQWREQECLRPHVKGTDMERARAATTVLATGQGLLANQNTYRPYGGRVLLGIALLQDPRASACPYSRVNPVLQVSRKSQGAQAALKGRTWLHFD